MSHFTTMRTQFVSKELLVRALVDLRAEFGLSDVREHGGVRGYSGAAASAELVVGTRNHGYDVGFRREGEAYVLVADWYGIGDIDQAKLLSRLRQRYAYHGVCTQLDAQNFTIVDETVGEDQTIRLTLRRAV